jgi:polygalacturonase
VRSAFRFAVGSEMSGSVFNLTVDNNYAGIHLKSARGRGGAVHALRFTNLVFHPEASVKQPFPFSASLFYSGTPPPTNATMPPRTFTTLLSKT